MLRKLSEEQQNKLIESAIDEFGKKGLTGAAIADIAKCAGISVGVIYKYYKNKEELFDYCLEHSLNVLGEVLDDAVSEETTLMGACEKLIRACQKFGRDHGPYIRMYHIITLTGGEDAMNRAEAIEALTARMYTSLITKEQEQGHVRKELDPGLFAMFFDNLLMMLHFSYGCKYYEERMKFYFPECEDQDERILRQLMLFIEGAFGIRE